MRKSIYIFPKGGNGIEAMDCIDEHNFVFKGFIDDDKSKFESDVFPICFNRNIISEDQDSMILAVPGNPKTFLDREKIISSLEIPMERFISVIHPSVHLGKNVQIGYNCLIMAGVVLTSNVKIGNHVCILPNTVIHHDVSIENYSLIGSNVVISGNTVVGQNCYIGSGSNIINGINVGEKTLIGLGSNIIKSVKPNSRIVGNPGRSI